jgi:Holliday junction DNA helicase RuvA
LIEFLQGILVSKSSDCVVLQAGGIGFRIAVSAMTLDKMPAPGSDILLPVHLHVREDEFLLYGFLSAEEKQCFKLLIQVSGIGPKLALSILSYYEVPALSQIILLGDLGSLTMIAGVGKKTGERLILELKDKVGKLGEPEGTPLDRGAPAQDTDDRNQAAAALAALGYHQQEIQKILTLVARDGIAGTEQIIRAALNRLMR